MVMIIPGEDIINLQGKGENLRELVSVKPLLQEYKRGEEGMTKRDKEILDFIKDFMLKNGTVPTLREIGRGVNLYSTRSVYDHMQKLIELGEIIPSKGNGNRYSVKGMRYVREDA